MTDSIKDLLANKSFRAPDEIEQIKRFVQKEFNEEPKVKIAGANIIITVSNAAVAGNLRYQVHQLQQDLNIDKKLLIRIG
jgi:ribosomal protein L31E